MPSVNSSNLIDLFNQLETSKNTKTKSELLGKAKYLIFNTLSTEQIIEFFGDKLNFESLFSLNIWTKNLDESVVTEFLEPYDIIEKIFSCFTSLLHLLNEFKPQIFFLISQDKDEKVKHILVKYLLQLTKSLKVEDFASVADRNQALSSIQSDIKEILPELVKQVSNTAISYCESLSSLICALIHKFDQLEENPNNYNVIFSDQTIDVLETLSKQNSIIRFRVFELLIKVATCSNERSLHICDSKFHLQHKLNDYLNDKHDILCKLNCIEILTDLAITKHGFEFLHNNGHLRILYQDLSNNHDSFIIPSIVKLFSVIAKNMPEQMNQNYPGYFEYLFKAALDDDIITNQIAIKLSLETFAYLLGSNQFKSFLLKHYSDKLDELIDRFIVHLRTTIKDELRISSLICIAELISPDPLILREPYDIDLKWQASESAANQTWINMSQLFYNRIDHKISHETLFNICLTMAKQPFTDTRLSAHLYFKALAQTKWGLSYLFTPNKYNATFLEDYLLNRSTEIEKQGFESKYELVKLITCNFTLNVDLHHLIDEHKLVKLNDYVRQGPFFTIAQSRVATENL